jgi:hypothetical protein
MQSTGTHAANDPVWKSELPPFQGGGNVHVRADRAGNRGWKQKDVCPRRGYASHLVPSCSADTLRSQPERKAVQDSYASAAAVHLFYLLHFAGKQLSTRWFSYQIAFVCFVSARARSAARQAHPNSFYRVELCGNPGWISHKHRVRRTRLRYQRIGGDNTISAYNQFSLVADDGCSAANPASLLDPDRSAFTNPLIFDWQRHILEFVIVIHDQGICAYDDIPLDVNTVSRGDLCIPVDAATILNDDHRLTLFLIGTVDAEVDVFADDHRVAEFDPVGEVSSKVPGVVNLYMPSDCRERVDCPDPGAIQRNWDPR